MAWGTWNPADKHAEITLSNGDLSADISALSVSFDRRAVRGTIVASGRRYYELTVDVKSGGSLIGIGLAQAGAPLIHGDYTSQAVRMYQQSGAKNGGGVFAGYGASWGQGDVISIVWDGDTGSLHFWKNGADQGEAFSGVTGEWYPFLYFTKDNSAHVSEVTAAFGATAWAYSPPSGFEGWSTRVRVAGQHTAPYALRPPLRVAHVAPYDLSRAKVMRGHSALYRLMRDVARQHAAPYASPLSGLHVARWSTLVAAQHAAVSRYSVGAAHRAPYALRRPARRAHASTWSATAPVSAAHRGRYTLEPRNRAGRAHRAIYGMADAAAVHVAARPVLEHAGRSVPLVEVELSAGDRSWGWAGRAELADVGDYAAIERDTRVRLELLGEAYELIVDSKQLQRSGPGGARATLALLSPAAVWQSPRARPMTRTWDAPVMARAVVEELLEQIVEWEMVDWLIPANRLSVTDASPLEVARQVVEAAGGVLQSRPDGGLLARHRFPRPVPSWAASQPDHVFTDVADNLDAGESQPAAARVDRVVIRDDVGRGAPLSLEVDARPGGLNRGALSFDAGESVGVLAHRGRSVTVSGPEVSAGGALRQPRQVYTVIEDVAFLGARSVELSRPASEILAVTWLGTSLGALELGPDQLTVTAASAGTAVARVTYRVEALAWRVQSPSVVAGLDEYPLYVRVLGDQAAAPGQLHIVVQRGAGQHPGPDVVHGLLGSLAAALSRGRAEIDAGEPLREVRLTCAVRPGVAPGQLAEVHDALQGASWRGQVERVTHRQVGPRATTSMEILRL